MAANPDARSQSQPDTTNEDWDRLEVDEVTALRNAVVTAGGGDSRKTSEESQAVKAKRSISELLKLHAQKGTDVKFSNEEASRVAEVLGRWINSESSPYEGEDDFFARSQDGSPFPPKPANLDASGRPQGRTESIIDSRPASPASIKG